MFRFTELALKSKHDSKRYQSRSYRGFYYRQFPRWQREASGVSKWNQQQSHRAPPAKRHFFGADNMASKGTGPEAYRWWGQQRHFLPNLPPADYDLPAPIGKPAWPSAWTDDFAADVTALTDDEIKEFLMELLTTVIFEETQKDGFELRRLDFEGKPMSELPDRRLIEEFILDEPALKDRVLYKVLDKTLYISPTSEQRAEIRDVPNLIRFVQAFVGRCRVPASTQEPVPEAVQDFLAAEIKSGALPAPLFGFQHALPQDDRSELLIKWQAQFQHPWQFGHAVYEPRDRESEKLQCSNATWLRMEAESARRDAFREYVNSGQAKEDHMRKIQEAAMRVAREE